jgi:hypothetical protein
MSFTEEDLTQLQLGAAYLAASIVQTLNESDPTFRARFVLTLEKAYRSLRDQATTTSGLEVLAWARELLKEEIT